MIEVSFYAAGVPKPQGSKRGFVQGGKVRLVESAGAALKDWRAIVAHEAAHAMRGAAPIEGPLSVVLTFSMPRPQRLPKDRPSWPDKRPDVDKLVRSVLDSCSAIVYRDDSQIVTLTARKIYALPNGTPGVRVQITSGAL